MKTAACYIRVSTEDQLEFSPDAQLRAMKRYCAENDLLLPEEFIYIDEGISGRSARKRPAFQNMIKKSKSNPKPFDVILVHKFDRFARNREDSVVYKSLLRSKLGIQVLSITENIGDDKMSVILESMLEAMAEYYSLNLSDEVKKGMSEKAKKGGVQTKPAFGYTVINNKFIPIVEEAVIVKDIFQRFVSGESYGQIANWLNSIGMHTKLGNPFRQRTIEYIISNPVYIGKLRWTNKHKSEKNNETITLENQHEPIIDKDLWYKAQNRYKKIKLGNRKYVKNKTENSCWLSGLLVCGNCGRTLGRNGNYLQCCGYIKSDCNISHSISIETAEKIVIEQLKADCLKADLAQITENQNINNFDKLLLYKNVENRLNKSLIRAKEAYISGIDTLEEYQKNKIKLQNELEKIQINTSCNKSNNNKDIEHTKDLLDFIQDKNISDTDKNNALKQIISKIVFIKPEKHLEIIYY